MHSSIVLCRHQRGAVPRLAGDSPALYPFIVRPSRPIAGWVAWLVGSGLRLINVFGFLQQLLLIVTDAVAGSLAGVHRLAEG